MKLKIIILMLIVACAFASAPVQSEAATSSLTFAGTVDWTQSEITSGYFNTYNGYTFTAGDTVKGLVEYDAATGDTSKLWVDIRKQDNSIHHFESFGSGVYNYNSYIANAHVFEITDSTSGTLNNLVLSNLTPAGVGTWYFDVDNGSTPFRVGGASVVTPIPAAAWLLGSGLLGLVGIRRRQK